MPSAKPRAVARALGALVAYAALVLALGRAWLGAAAADLPAGDIFSFADDARLHTWVIGWIAQALRTAPSHLLDAPIYAPLAGQLTGTEHMASTQLLAVPLLWLTGNAVLAMNATIAVSYVFTALAMRALLLAYGFGAAVAWVGGVLFMLGPMRVPANVQSLQYIAGHLALVAWALRRLRDEPSGRRVLYLAGATAAGVLSSYYMLPMIAVAAPVLVACELWRRPSQRAAFVGRAASAGALAAIPLLVVSLPYLQRGDVNLAIGKLESVRSNDVRNIVMTLGPLVFGWVTLLLMMIGSVVGWVGNRATRFATVVGLVLAGVGVVLTAQPWPLPQLIAATMFRYLRMQTRFLVIVGFGATLLAAAGLESGTRRLPGAARHALLAAVTLLFVWTRGTALSGKPDPVRALGTDRTAYAAVARAVRGLPVRPLLELPRIDAHAVDRGSLLPLGQLETDAMLGGLVHELPLITGHSAYPPPHWPLIELLLRRLPQSMDELVDLTDVGWILLRPADYWEDRLQRAGIAQAPGVARVFDRDGWTLLRVARASRRPDWVAALAHGPRAGVTLLDTPLAPVAEPRARVSVERGMLGEKAAGEVVALALRVTNAGATPWPILSPPSSLIQPVVRLMAHWQPAGRALERSEMVPVYRDIWPGETLAIPYYTKAPAQSGTYQVTFSIEQVGSEAPFPSAEPPVSVRVTVADPNAMVIACLGDSNTAAGWPTPERERWCEYVATQCGSIDGRPVRFVNHAIGGAVASAPYAMFQGDAAIKSGAERVILAFGTNDVLSLSKSPAALAADLQALCRALAPRPCWVATVPPTLMGEDPTPWNDAIRAAFAAEHVIDFTSTVVPSAGDLKHLDDASEHLLAERVRGALRCTAP